MAKACQYCDVARTPGLRSQAPCRVLSPNVSPERTTSKALGMEEVTYFEFLSGGFQFFGLLRKWNDCVTGRT